MVSWPWRRQCPLRICLFSDWGKINKFWFTKLHFTTQKGWISTNRSTLTTVHDYSEYNNKKKCATCACLRCTLIILMNGPLFIFYVNTQTSTNHNWIKKNKNEDLLSLQQFTKNSRMTKNLRIKYDQSFKQEEKI